jgi:hypothetical protein
VGVPPHTPSLRPASLRYSPALQILRNHYQPIEDLAVPKLRRGTYSPEFLLTRRRRAEQALVAVVCQACVAGVSTRRVDDLVQALGIEGISKFEVSRLAAELDKVVAEFRERPLKGGPYRYLWIDALVRHEAPTDRVGGKDPPATCRSRPLKLEAA